jgi:hypothetical protein
VFVHKVPFAALGLPPKYTFTTSKLRFWQRRRRLEAAFFEKTEYQKQLFGNL